MSSSDEAPTRYLVALLFDPAARAEHAAHPARSMAAFGLTADQALAFADLDMDALQLEADARRRYLMSAACRAYPLTAGALGAAPDGPERLAAFLSHHDALRGAAARNAAFGAHLRRLLDLPPASREPQVVELLRPVLDLEAGLVQTAAQLRATVSAGHGAPPPERWRSRDRKRRGLVLPPHLLVATLPTSPGVLRAALHGLRPEDAWQRIRGGDLSWSRVRAVAQADAAPVTVLARAVAKGVATTRGASGAVAPQVEVAHQTVELAGPAPGLLRQCDGSMRLADLPQRQRRLASALLDAGLLTLGPEIAAS